MKRYTITVNDLTIEIRESRGDGDPLFLFHSNSSAAESYDVLLKGDLGKKRRIIAVSYPGHGYSSPAHDPLSTYNIKALGEFSANVVKTFGFNRYWLLGQSLGGHALIESLQHFPDALGLLLVSAPPISLQTLGSAFKPDPSAGTLYKGELNDDEVTTLASCFSRHVQNGTIDKIKKMIQQTDSVFRSTLAQSLGKGMLGDEIKCLEQSRLPIGILGGTDDQFLNGKYYQTIPTERLWQRKVVMFEGCGHAMHLEQPETFEAVVAEFLNATGH